MLKRYKKKDLLNSVQVLEKVNNGLVRGFRQESPASMEELTACQKVAIALGNMLEMIEVPGGQGVRLLEDYCESVYQLSLVLSDADRRRKLAKKIQRQLYAVKSEIMYRLPEGKREIVFLPYKASMWDSLESIWKAASEDESCDTYVIPIPYYDKKPDGSVGRIYYEGDRYPEYVPVIPWCEYSIQERRPDIIYIHNPYDECNYITSVHPNFYVSELKKYTEMLVYIPYFVAVDDKVGRHFCSMPGVLNADRVIVQSEAVRQSYIQEIHKYEETYHCRNAFGNIEKKIQAVGSPKYDRVELIKRQDFQIPEEWKRVIPQEDGRKKKIVLYNTTIDGLLKHNEKMLTKIRKVLEKFRNSKEAVLLWRPHPLLQSTLEAMRPKLAEEYRNLVKEYRQEGYGIFDDSADMYRAFALSDAYYGDMSSVVELYRRTGKPVLVESVFYGGEIGLIFEALVLADDGTAYASCSMFNGLFQVDLDTGNCSYIGLFPEETADKFRMHSGAVYADGNLYFKARNTDYFSVYRIADKSFQVISDEDFRLLHAEFPMSTFNYDTAHVPKEEGFGRAVLFQAKEYCYFVKFKEKANRNPLNWNSCECFRVRIPDDGFPESYCFRFSGGREKFAAEHREYLEKVRAGQTVPQESIFYELEDFLSDISGEKAEKQERTEDADPVRETETAGSKIHKMILKALVS